MHDASESIPGEKSAEPEGLASKTLGNTADEQGEIIQLSGPQIIARIKSSPSKFTLVNFWASWCGPCRREFPMLMGLRDNMAPQGIEVQFVSLDEPESVPVAIEFAEQHQLELPIFIAQRPISALKEAIHPGWPGMLPATFLFDNAGNLQHFWGGPVYEHELLPILENALAGEDVSGETRFGLSAGKDMRKQ